MAVNNSRSMNHDLMLGATDRQQHSVVPNRGGMVEMDWPIQRDQYYLRGSWSPQYLSDAIQRQSDPGKYSFDAGLRDRVSIVNGTGARTARPTARNQFEASPYPTPLDATYTSWPDSW